MGQVVARTGAIYGRWIAANGWSEALGLGTTLALGWRIAPSLERATGVLTVLAGALAAVLMGMVLEDVVVGAAQGAVVHRALPTLSRRSWVLATVLGAGIAWILGMIPSTIMALRPPETGAPPPAEPRALRSEE